MDGGDPAGGSSELVHLIDRCGECLIADLKSYYNVDLRDVLRDDSGLSPRLVLTYVRHMPLESATVAELRGGQHFRGWSPELYRLTDLLDAIQHNTYAFIAANSRRKPQVPKPVKRPDGTASKPKSNSFAALARAHLAAQKKDGGKQ